MTIRITNAALDDGVEDKEIILRGRIDPDSLKALLVDDYQREIQPLAKITDLANAFESGSVQDIQLGMRGERYTDKDGIFTLQDPVYIIDGLQRVSAAKLVVQRGKLPRLGAEIHFGTTKEWERERFHILNTRTIKLSPNVLLRNLREKSKGVQFLYMLSHDKDLALQNRISWTQRMQRSELLTARLFTVVVGHLHSYLLPGQRYSSVDAVASGMDRLIAKVGRQQLRENIIHFWDVVEAAWGVRLVTYSTLAVHLKGTFLWALSEVFARHQNFWDGDVFHVDKNFVQKLKLFSVQDPSVKNLASASGKAREMMLMLMVEHINSGKRINRLKLRRGMTAPAKAEKPSNGLAELAREHAEEGVEAAV